MGLSGQQVPGSVGPRDGGKAVYGAAVGILMLEARFPRIPGDLGNASTFDFPVLYRVVRGASPDRVVRNDAQGLLDAFIAAGRELVGDGADGITTSCGFLSLFQAELAAALEVPVASSALMQVSLVDRILPPGRRAGILTIDSRALTPRHLAKVELAEDTPIVGTEAGREFTRAILDDRPSLDPDAACADLLDAAAKLLGQHPEVGAIVLECTNMTPYAAEIRRVLGVPVFGMATFVRWFHAGLLPRSYDWRLADPRPNSGPDHRRGHLRPR